LIGGLVIIWAVFLLPFGRRTTSPRTTVEEFERKMDLLAETNGRASGRWVLVPRKGERFMGPRDRERARLRRRRRTVFTVLLEATVLTLLIGLFPPLRMMLLGTAVLGFVLLVYIGLLVKVRADQAHRAGVLRAQRAREMAAYRTVPARAVREALVPAANGRASANGNGHVNGNGNGNKNENGHVGRAEELSIVDDDCHVIVRRAAEIEAGFQATAR
jgi:hypothetical protein